MTGIEPAPSAWEAEALPLSYIPGAAPKRGELILRHPDRGPGSERYGTRRNHAGVENFDSTSSRAAAISASVTVPSTPP